MGLQSVVTFRGPMYSLRLLLLVQFIVCRRIASDYAATCNQTDDQIRSSFASIYSEVVINCLSVTPSGSVEKVILSAFNSSNNVMARFTVTCNGSVLVTTPSPLNASRSTSAGSCSEACGDAEYLNGAIPIIFITIIICCPLVFFCIKCACCYRNSITIARQRVPTLTSQRDSYCGLISSTATLENARYSLHSMSSAVHPNEDRHFVTVENHTAVLAVLDGHDGDRGVAYSLGKFQKISSKVGRHCSTNGDMTSFLKAMFHTIDANFFNDLKAVIRERESLQAIIAPGMTSYQAFLQYPREVSRLQELEPLISGGCTAVLAVVCGNKLYVANVGDSRAVLVYQSPNGTLETLQLSTDHDVKNEDELKRLEKLGLDSEELKRAGRLGPQENTRSIGDYNIKEGYKSVDVLSHASGPPGTAEPSVITADIYQSFLYLLVMSDGVYKSMEAAEPSTDAVSDVAKWFHAACTQYGFTSASQVVLKQLAQHHKKAFENWNSTACRKRDDMTLLVYNFRPK